MKKATLLSIAAISGALVVSGIVVNDRRHEQRHYAEVISAKLVTARVEAPRERCYQEMVRPMQDAAWLQTLDRHATKASTIADRQVDQPNTDPSSAIADSPDTYLERRCETVYDAEQQPAGYDVEYHYAGKSGTVHMDHDPGKRIPVENGELVLNNDEGDDNAANG